MLESVLRYLNNRFDSDPQGVPYGSRSGEFTVSGWTLDADWLHDGQYYWIEGSVFNDGLHRNPDKGMVDERFTGRVVSLAVPREVVAIADEIEGWCEANAEAIASPYQSESFGGYSYSKASGGSRGNEAPSEAWQLHFGARLRPFRKLSRDWA